jgi:hypothetical protein
MAPAHATGPQTFRHRAGRVYRGTRKRLRRIRLHENTPPGLWILVVALVLFMIATFVLLIRHPPLHHH